MKAQRYERAKSAAATSLQLSRPRGSFLGSGTGTRSDAKAIYLWVRELIRLGPTSIPEYVFYRTIARDTEFCDCARFLIGYSCMCIIGRRPRSESSDLKDCWNIYFEVYGLKECPHYRMVKNKARCCYITQHPREICTRELVSVQVRPSTSWRNLG